MGLLLGRIASFLLPLIGGLLGVAKQVGGSLGTMLALAMLMLLFRVFIMLAKAYVSLVFLIIFGPLIIAFSALPQEEGVMSWIRSLLGNALVFPVTGLVLGLGGLIINKIAGGAAIWSPPLLGGDKDFVAAAMALGLLFIVPEIDGMIQKALAPKARGLEIKGLEKLAEGTAGSFKDIGKGFSAGSSWVKSKLP